MQRSIFHLELGLDDLLRVVPRAAGVRHEHSLIQPEQRNRYQVTDEKERLDEREPQRGEEYGQEDVEHPLLRILRADLDDLLAVGDRRLGNRVIEPDIGLDELDRAIRAG